MPTTSPTPRPTLVPTTTPIGVTLSWIFLDDCSRIDGIHDLFMGLLKKSIVASATQIDPEFQWISSKLDCGSIVATVSMTIGQGVGEATFVEFLSNQTKVGEIKAGGFDATAVVYPQHTPTTYPTNPTLLTAAPTTVGASSSGDDDDTRVAMIVVGIIAVVVVVAVIFYIGILVSRRTAAIAKEEFELEKAMGSADGYVPDGYARGNSSNTDDGLSDELIKDTDMSNKTNEIDNSHFYPTTSKKVVDEQYLSDKFEMDRSSEIPTVDLATVSEWLKRAKYLEGCYVIRREPGVDLHIGPQYIVTVCSDRKFWNVNVFLSKDRQKLCFERHVIGSTLKKAIRKLRAKEIVVDGHTIKLGSEVVNSNYRASGIHNPAYRASLDARASNTPEQSPGPLASPIVSPSVGEPLAEQPLDMFAQSALIIVDVQNDFVMGRVGGYETSETDIDQATALIARINKLRKRHQFGVVVLAQESHPHNHCSFAASNPGYSVGQRKDIVYDDETVEQIMWPVHCVVGTKGCEFHPKLLVLDSDYVQRKGQQVDVECYSAFRNVRKSSKRHELLDHLKDWGISNVFVCGLSYDFGVGHTAIHAKQAGLETYVISDLSRTVVPHANRKWMRERLEEAGVDEAMSDMVGGITAILNHEATPLTSPNLMRSPRSVHQSTHRQGTGVAIQEKGTRSDLGFDHLSTPQTETASFSDCALIVVDVQNDFITGSMQVPNADSIIPLINNVRKQFNFGVVVLTQDSHPSNHCSFAANNAGSNVHDVVPLPAPDGSSKTVDQVMWPSHCVIGTHGWEFPKSLDQAPNDLTIMTGTKANVDSYSAFNDNYSSRSTGLADELVARKIKTVYVCGLAYDYCVGLTCLDAVKAGFETYIIGDATGSIAADSTHTMRVNLEAAGVMNVQHDQIAALAKILHENKPFVPEIRSTGALAKWNSGPDTPEPPSYETSLVAMNTTADDDDDDDDDDDEGSFITDDDTKQTIDSIGGGFGYNANTRHLDKALDTEHASLITRNRSTSFMTTFE